MTKTNSRWAWLFVATVGCAPEASQTVATSMMEESITSGAATTTIYTLTWPSNLDAVGDQCGFGQGDNLPVRSGGWIQARREESLSISGLAGRRIKSLGITGPSGFAYDDDLLLAINTKYIMANDQRIPAYNAGMYPPPATPIFYDWSSVAGQDIDNHGTEPPYCAGNASLCVIPPTETPGNIEVAISDFSSIDKGAYPSAPDARTFTLVTTGDDDLPLDCRHGELTLVLTVEHEACTLDSAGNCVVEPAPAPEPAPEPPAPEPTPNRYDILQYQNGDAVSMFPYVSNRFHVFLGRENNTVTAQAFTDVALGFDASAPYRVGDFDGDGDDDVLQVGNCGGLACFRVAFTNPNATCSGGGAGCFDQPVWHGQANTWNVASSHQFLVGDVNGDGRDDVVQYQGGVSGSTRLHVWLAQPGGYFTFNGQSWTDVGLGFSPGVPHRMGDFDGDGDDDLLQVGNCGGLACFRVARANPGGTCNGLSEGCFDPAVWHGPAITWGNGIVYSHDFLIGDVNADGREDIVQHQSAGPAGTRLHVWWGRLNAQFSQNGEAWTDVNIGYDPSRPYRMGDFNGDQAFDFLQVGICSGRPCFRIAWGNPGDGGRFNPSAWHGGPSVWGLANQELMLVGRFD